ncbi:MAG: hypothetical protein K8U57_04885 [Planctomycetes bacterium]|nr:hypothetical protein [Planctomycetota bacterium]
MNSLLVGLACFAAHVAVTLIWLRIRRGPSPVTRHAASALSTHIIGVIVAANLVEGFAYWPVAAVSGFGAVCFLFAFSAVYKSVSLRILTQLDRTPGNAIPFVVIARDYVQPEFEARVAVLVKMDCAAELDGGYVATETGNTTARRIGVIQRACGIRGSGLYSESEATAPTRRPTEITQSFP